MRNATQAARVQPFRAGQTQIAVQPSGTGPDAFQGDVDQVVMNQPARTSSRFMATAPDVLKFTQDAHATPTTKLG